MKEQEECHALAEDLLDTLATFLPFTAAVDPEAMKISNTKQIVGNMLELYGKAGELIMEYSSQDVLGKTPKTWDYYSPLIITSLTQGTRSGQSWRK